MTNKKKIMIVFGTRPEAIKMAPLYHALKFQKGIFDTLVCVTAQHRQMLDPVLDVFEIIPDIDLDLMKHGQDLFDLTSSILLGMREVIQIHKPDVLLVHGDTTTSLAASMAGFYLGVQIGHVEAGLRTFDMNAPFPEEFNRQVTSKIAKWHFAPTECSRQNLLNEQISDQNIIVTGNTVIDALFWVLKRFDLDISRRNKVYQYLKMRLSFEWDKKRFVLITAHRRENFGQGILQICKAIKELAHRFLNVHFVYPIHLNPNVKIPVQEMLSGIKNIDLIEPLDYEPFACLLKHSYIVLTDSGGVQEEAPSLGKPVLVMREVTERPEALKAGNVRLVGANKEKIIANVSELIENEESYTSMSQSYNLYGDGRASERIVSKLKSI